MHFHNTFIDMDPNPENYDYLDCRNKVLFLVKKKTNPEGCDNVQRFDLKDKLHIELHTLFPNPFTRI